MKRKVVVLVDLGNQDDDGSPLNLFDYLRNELDNRRVKVWMHEAQLGHDINDLLDSHKEEFK